MTSPDDKDPVRSELEYAPPWVREQVAREKTPREPAPREQMTRDQFRATLRQSAGAPAQQLAPNNPNNPESRNFGDDRPWHQRALEPELVPAPPAGSSTLWPMMLRLGAVCSIAALVAAAVVFLFNPRQIAHKIAQADAQAPASISDDATPSPIEPSREVPALSAEAPAAVTTPQMPQTQEAAATPPQPSDGQGQVPTAPPPQAEKPAEPAAPAQQLASLPTPDASPADIRPSTAPAVNEPAPRPVDAKPAPSPAPIQTAPAQAAPPSVAKPEIALDQNEIDTLIRRGKNLLNDGDFAAARVLFERAANAGSAEAALALGSTYDPNVIKRLGAIMVRPDVEKARQWYQLAADRGSAAASLQLANLPQSR
jgi:hypothetical protein